MVGSGRGEATFDLDVRGPVTIAVGPEHASAEDLFRRDTPTVTVRPTGRGDVASYHVDPIVVAPHIWLWWRRWCRQFTITGHLYGTDGNPVPGAQVTASDVNWFWWWSSSTAVGSAITDASGYFEISFTWCCGWLPWYWWDLRQWRLDPELVDRIQPILALNPGLRISRPDPRLQLHFADFNPQPDPPGRGPARRTVGSVSALTPATLPALREKLLASLPDVPKFERLRLWPWWPWTPWFDCGPDIIFKATQTCGGLGKVIVDESVWDVRLNIPTHLNVTLIASPDACTIPPNTGQPEGGCFLFTQACDVPASEIGLTCDTALGGLADPGSRDRPFTGSVYISGQFGSSAVADHYGLEYRPALACPSSEVWSPVPTAAPQEFIRQYFDATLPYPNQWIWVPFPPLPKVAGGEAVTVYEGRQHFQDVSSPPFNWGNVMTGRSWAYNVDVTAVMTSAGYFSDGAYEFRVVGYTANPDGTLTARGSLPGCGEPNAEGVNNNNDFALYFANPTAAETRPDASIKAIKFNGVVLQPCGIQRFAPGEAFSFEVDLTASDGEGFLDEYTLSLQHGVGGPVTLIPIGPGTTLAAAGADEKGPTYADAVAQGATRPRWYGGNMVLTVVDARSLFPESCAYELILNVYKRNIVDCEGSDAYYQLPSTRTLFCLNSSRCCGELSWLRWHPPPPCGRFCEMSSEAWSEGPSKGDALV
ncbi:Ig-like domain-containing protein [Sphingomonas bacterium]|uniref:Ig-like domain-containing protein n=1 Tax=Sphingomonas bacterium TaxID=1895847 RepID=UPI0015771C5B|nr:carboxypeptidase-like regulatory domain-containing protein [Sphingomonas bacterium]